MSDTAADAPATATTAAGESKPSTFLDKLSRFTIGKDRGELPEKGEFFLGGLIKNISTEQESNRGDYRYWGRIRWK